MSDKEDDFLTKEFMSMIRKGTTDFKIDEGVITEDDSFDIITVAILFKIDIPRMAQIVVYLKKLMKDHQGSVADILRDIYHNITIEHEKYFAAYVLGKNFRTLFSKITTVEELTDFLNPIDKKLDLSNLVAISEYVHDIITQQKPGASPAYSMRKIIESDFEENDKVFIVFYYALM